MKLRKLILLSSMVIAVAVLAPSTVQAAANGTDRPFKGTETVTAVIDIGAHIGNVNGTFRYSDLGNGTFHADTTLTPLTPTTTQIAGTNTYVAANGDRLFTTIAGTSSMTSPTESEVIIVDTITGGTGRFADASGTFTVTGPAVTVSFNFPFVTSTGTNTMEGQISF
jgi:hypothetical protein